MSKSTKVTIIETAVQLFNDCGTGSVSTNHIAKEAKMSTGNLYYHFKNKEQIIRAIFECMVADWDKLWVSPLPDWRPNIDDIRSMIRRSLQLEWKYRFFYRELIVLMKVDSQLRERHQQVQVQRIEEQKLYFQHFIDAGVIQKPEDDSKIESLLTISWMISNYWLSFLESGGQEVTEERMEEGIALIMTVMSPYISDGEGE